MLCIGYTITLFQTLFGTVKFGSTWQVPPAHDMIFPRFTPPMFLLSFPHAEDTTFPCSFLHQAFSLVTLNNLFTQNHHMAETADSPSPVFTACQPQHHPPKPCSVPCGEVCSLRDLTGFHWLRVRWVLIRVMWGKIPSVRQTL